MCVSRSEWKAHSTYIYICNLETLDLNCSHLVLGNAGSKQFQQREVAHTIAWLPEQSLIQEGEVPIWEEAYGELAQFGRIRLGKAQTCLNPR